MDAEPEIFMMTAVGKDYSINWVLFTSKGSDEAFSQIYYEHYDMLYHVGLKYTSDIQVVEDSIQNIFIYLLRNRKRLQPVINVGGYLLKSFRRQLFLDLKKQEKLFFFNKSTEAQFDYFNNTEPSVFEQEDNTELQTALKNSVCKLSARQQEIIYLRYDCEMEYEEIARILDISVESCYKSIYRSIKTIKADIEQAFVKRKDLFFWLVFLCRNKITKIS